MTPEKLNIWIAYVGKIVILLALGTAAYLIYKLYLKQLLQQGTPGKIKIALIALGFIFVALAVTGRAHALYALIGAGMTQIMRIAPLLVRYAPFLQKYIGFGSAGLGGGLGNAFGQSGANQTAESRVTTHSLVMILNQHTGQISGEVLAGELAGRQLHELNLSELQQLYTHCEAQDQEALRLLQAYIARERPEWGPDQTTGNSANNVTGSDGISVREAYDILGLDQGAQKPAIVSSHRALMAQFHPDKGGSNYLASKINEAKRILMEQLENKV